LHKGWKGEHTVFVIGGLRRIITVCKRPKYGAIVVRANYSDLRRAYDNFMGCILIIKETVNKTNI